MRRLTRTPGFSGLFMALFAVSLLVPWMATATAWAADVAVTVSGLRSTEGRIKAALFQGDSGFPVDYDSAYAVKLTRAVEGARIVFRDVPPGEYAVSLYHDENRSGKLDTNFIGMPKEGVGVSRNPKGRLGPPRFRDAAFAVPATGSTAVQLPIVLKYL